MLKNKKLILTTLGGTAICAGVLYYFYKKNITITQKYEILFKQYEKEFFLSNIIPLNTQIKFDQLFDQATYDENEQETVYERLKYQGETLTNQGSVYYDCYDCSIIRKEGIKVKKSDNFTQSYLIICEDCFDISKHKGHRFEKCVESFGLEYKCSCGDQNLMEQICFCESHQGFDQTKQIGYHHKQKQQLLWNNIEKFILDSFYIVFNRMSNLTMNKNYILTQNEIDQIGRLNIYFTQIINKINEIIELNPPSIHNIASIFQQKLQRPINLESIKRNKDNNHAYNKKWEVIFSKNSKLNTDITIIEYIIIFYQFINDNNDSILKQLFQSLAAAEQSFRLLFVEKLYKYISFTIREDKIGQESYNSQINLNVFPSFTLILTDYIFLNSTFNHLLENLGEDIFCPIQTLTKYLDEKRRSTEKVDIMIKQFITISFAMFQSTKSIKTLLMRYPHQSIESLYSISFNLYSSNCIIIKKSDIETEENQIKMIVSMINSISLFPLEKQILYSFINIYEGLILNGDEDFLQKILSILCSKFQKYVLKSRQFLEQSNDSLFKSQGLAFLIHFPMLVALSERKLFTKEVLNNFLSKNFKFSDTDKIVTDNIDSSNTNEKVKDEQGIHEQEYQKITRRQFLTSLQIVLDSFLCKNSGGQFVALFQASAYLEQYQFLQQIFYEFQEIYRKHIYNFYTLTHSLILLLSEGQYDEILECNIANQYVNLVQHAKANSPHEILALRLILEQIIQIIFDPMPFFSVFGHSLHLFFPQLCLSNQLQDQIQKLQTTEQKQFQSNLKLIMISQFLENEQETSLNEFNKTMNNYLTDQNIINNCITEVFSIKQHEKDNNIEYLISLQPQHQQQFSLRPHLYAGILDLNQLLLKFQQIYLAEIKIYLIESDINLNELFEYQLELLKKIYLNENFQQSIIQLFNESRDSQKEDQFLTIFHVYNTLLLLIQQEEETLMISLNERSILKRIELLYNKEIYIYSSMKQLNKNVINYQEKIMNNCLYQVKRFLTRLYPKYLSEEQCQIQ